MLEILDAVIATAAVVLGLSLIVQAIQQIFKQVFDLKSSYMRAELLALFADDEKIPSPKFSWFANFRSLASLAKRVDKIAKRIVKELEERMSTFGLTDLHLLEGIDASRLKEILQALPIARDDDQTVREKFEKAFRQIDLWLDISKKAFQEHYERRMKVWAFGISTVVVIVLNANIFDIYRDFSHNQPLREAAIALADRFVKTSKDSLIVREKTASGDTSIAVAKPDSVIKKEIKEKLDQIQSLLDEKSFQVMGWTVAKLDNYLSSRLNFALMLAGWFGMTLLLSLGAPFWYDFLKTVMGVKDKLKGGITPKESATPPASNQVTASSPDIPPVG
jgi:hypothetical protein